MSETHSEPLLLVTLSTLRFTLIAWRHRHVGVATDVFIMVECVLHWVDVYNMMTLLSSLGRYIYVYSDAYILHWVDVFNIVTLLSLHWVETCI